MNLKDVHDLEEKNICVIQYATFRPITQQFFVQPYNGSELNNTQLIHKESVYSTYTITKQVQ